MNREIFPGSLYPLSGDVTSQAGSILARVTGWLGIPLNFVTLSGGEIYVFNPNLNKWDPKIFPGVQINGVPYSFDYEVSVNAGKQIKVNGV